jgi:hypothetical protein
LAAATALTIAAARVLNASQTLLMSITTSDVEAEAGAAGFAAAALAAGFAAAAALAAGFGFADFAAAAGAEDGGDDLARLAEGAADAAAPTAGEERLAAGMMDVSEEKGEDLS